ncbi:hypothetical protein AXG93_402s1510 [Marchantia polymorpha subsp. ruderalis]|uniref:Uncharacterized protein n=1 Tax=Marchantia polymorpha subsp. ruderalis TaxID=1480154 RepID=A0A176WC06_MARPO|nr:hypothetical protein AXG93_402s1510 [Marchantia polymorpha subsp. ruderalis]
MEGAGASIVSYATEKRGMDSADEEPELPSDIQDLVQRLEGQGEPITELPNLSEPEFRKFFPRRASLSTIIGWRSQVRLRVLEAMGSCNTLEILNVSNICGGDTSMLTPSEWEVVLRGFRSSSVLEKIIVDHLWFRESDDAEVESLCFQLGRILKSSSVTELVLYNRLSARCFSNLASGLRGHSDSKLKSLDLREAWEDSTAVKYVADMISSAPVLETLRLGGDMVMEDETAGILAHALIQSSSLKELRLERGKWGGPLLLKALAGHDRNRSIERLVLREMVGLGDCLTELLISNRSLKEVKFYTFGMRPEELHKLGEAIRDNAIVTTIFVLFDFRYGDWKSIEALARSASSDVKDPIVELELETSEYHEVMLSLNLLGRVLRGEITSLKSLSICQSTGFLKSLSISTGPIGTSGTNQDRPEGILSMNGRTGETCVLKRLGLSALSEDVWKGVWKDLLLCLRGNTSLTHLDLCENRLDEETFRDMMGLLQVNLSLQKINVSRTSWARDGKAALIQEALKQNEKRAAYMSVFREAGLAFGDAKAGRLFLCGSPLAEMMKSITSYMNDVGSIVSIPNFDYIIVDPNWLTNKLLGELVAVGQNFLKKTSSVSYASKDGFVSEDVFAWSIEEFLNKQPEVKIGVDRDTEIGVDRKVIENILINLDLCFKAEDPFQYFIPSFVPEYESAEGQIPQELADEKSKKWRSRVGASKFVGIRIQCQDERTMSLNAGFFPCFEVILKIL